MADTPRKGWTSNTAVVAGIAILALAAGWFALTKSKDAACALTAAGVSSIVLGVTHERSVEQIVGTAAAGAIVPEACKAVVESLIDTPSETVTIQLKVPSGTVTKTVPGTTVLAPPSPAAGSDVQRVIDCFLSYRESRFLDDLCTQGVIEPH
jgi:hypothetical protein